MHTSVPLAVNRPLNIERVHEFLHRIIFSVSRFASGSRWGRCRIAESGVSARQGTTNSGKAEKPLRKWQTRVETLHPAIRSLTPSGWLGKYVSTLESNEPAWASEMGVKWRAVCKAKKGRFRSRCPGMKNCCKNLRHSAAPPAR